MFSWQTRGTVFTTPFLPPAAIKGSYFLRLSLGVNFLDHGSCILSTHSRMPLASLLKIIASLESYLWVFQ